MIVRPSSPGSNTAGSRDSPCIAAHRPLHRADDVAALAQGPQGLLVVGMDGPGAKPHLVGQAQALQVLQAAELRSTVSVCIEVFPPVHDGFYRQESGDLLMPGKPHETSFPEA